MPEPTKTFLISTCVFIQHEVDAATQEEAQQIFKEEGCFDEKNGYVHPENIQPVRRCPLREAEIFSIEEVIVRRSAVRETSSTEGSDGWEYTSPSGGHVWMETPNSPSSFIRAVGYKDSTATLYVNVNGRMYVYFDVSFDDHHELLTSDHPGAFFNRIIRHYEFEVLGEELPVV